MNKKELLEKMKAAKEVKDQEKQSKENQDQLSQSQAALKAQVEILQRQLDQKESDSKEKKLQEQAERLRKEQEALEADADLRKTLGVAFEKKTAGSEEELDQKELIAIMAEAVGSAVDANTKLLLSKVSELVNATDAKVDLTQKALVELVAGITVNQARSQHDDFDDFKDDIREILTHTSGLSAEDAYLLAKSKKTKGQPTQKQIESERPGQAPSFQGRTVIQPSAEREPKLEAEDEIDEFASPRKVFKSAVSKAIDKVLAARQK